MINQQVSSNRPGYGRASVQLSWPPGVIFYCDRKLFCSVPTKVFDSFPTPQFFYSENILIVCNGYIKSMVILCVQLVKNLLKGKRFPLIENHCLRTASTNTFRTFYQLENKPVRLWSAAYPSWVSPTQPNGLRSPPALIANDFFLFHGPLYSSEQRKQLMLLVVSDSGTFFCKFNCSRAFE